ncbi:MAG: NAD-dependent epimerase/dehydratase [Candidatus Woesebacteria bacterium GW2011_GWB1_38_5b]|uniref:NAD-dependent epimerase/dehydratase n=1 Tax=Candidatus Woesebacteria bacterium GW2011_GWB1_38_5b TaxID=1618569 RepID=A0A0G0MQG8_9BACT|nr:MAG: NAD-dependent epimerase/dehydratase [Candidatus Woesebacteria bacterium GW2011_GWB1_38_5b]
MKSLPNTLKLVLVTGGAGYIGSVLIPELLKLGYGVRVLDNLTYGGNGMIANFSNPNFEFMIGDTRDLGTVKKALEGVNAIIHLAALVGFPLCRKKPRDAEEVNHLATVQLNKLRKKNQLLIFASTGSNYGHIPSGYCTEKTPLNPISIYGKTKTAAERAISKSPNVIIYRFATAFGISPRLRLDLLINDFTYQALRKKSLIVYDKNYKRTFIHVRDIARSLIFALENSDKMVGETYNIGDESLNSDKEHIVNILKKKVNFILHYVKIDKGDEDQRNYWVDYSKIKSLGFKTQVSLEQGIDEMLKAFKVIDLENPYSNVD